MNRKSFVLYADTGVQIDLLSYEQAGILFKQIFDYIRGKEVVQTDDTAVQAIFAGIKNHLDRDHDKYLKKCECNRENGKKGGRPPKNNNKTTYDINKYVNGVPEVFFSDNNATK